MSILKEGSFNDIAEDYQSCLDRWDRTAVIRTRPRRLLQDFSSDSLIFYPTIHEPLVAHPLVRSKDEIITQNILTHSAYRFMLGVAEVETNVIIHFCSKIYNSEIDFNYPTKIKHDMLSIIIDEAHHAYIALDYIDQIEGFTKIKPLVYHQDVELSYTMRKYLPLLAPPVRDAFEVVAICLGENALTKELFEMKRGVDVHPFFTQVMADHMMDEGRHSKIFCQLLAYTWKHLDEVMRRKIIDILPNFIFDYVGNDLNKAAARVILTNLEFIRDDVDTLISDTYMSITDRKQFLRHNPIVSNLMRVIERVGLLSEDYAKEIFYRAGLFS
jgi:hypothetical protein